VKVLDGRIRFAGSPGAAVEASVRHVTGPARGEAGAAAAASNAHDEISKATRPTRLTVARDCQTVLPTAAKNLGQISRKEDRDVKKLASLAAVGAVVLLVAAAVAVAAVLDSYKVSATMKAGNETPKPTGVKASAKGSFTGSYTESKTGGTLKWKLTFSGLTGQATAAHIHKGKPGVAGPVIVPLCGPCSSGQSGTMKISKAVIKVLESHDAYVNVHTSKNQGGEIRGSVKVTGS